MERLRAILVGDWRSSTVSWSAAEGALRLALTAAAFVQQVRWLSRAGAGAVRSETCAALTEDILNE